MAANNAAQQMGVDELRERRHLSTAALLTAPPQLAPNRPAHNL
jgi:hypothetical protein